MGGDWRQATHGGCAQDRHIGVASGEGDRCSAGAAAGSSGFHKSAALGHAAAVRPTTVYAALLENRYKGVLHKSDLASANPYNTYAHAGLPPGPIANPGLSALQAALRPAEVDYLYFVAKADGSGSHHFSATLGEHEKAVLAYRKNAHQ